MARSMTSSLVSNAIAITYSSNCLGRRRVADGLNLNVKEMSYLLGWVWLMSFIVGMVLGLVVNSILSPFLKQKAQDLATKQDIGEITRRIESIKEAYATSLEAIKAENNRALEAMKAELQVIVAAETSAQQEAYKSLMDLFESIARIFWSDLDVSFGDLPTTREAGALLDERRQETVRAINSLWPLLARVWIHVSDSELTTACNGVVFRIIEAKSDFTREMSSVKSWLESLVRVLNDDGFSVEDRRIAHEAFSDAVDQYRQSMGPHLKEVEQRFASMLDALRRYLASRGKGLPPLPGQLG